MQRFVSSSLLKMGIALSLTQFLCSGHSFANENQDSAGPNASIISGLDTEYPELRGIPECKRPGLIGRATEAEWNSCPIILKTPYGTIRVFKTYIFGIGNRANEIVSLRLNVYVDRAPFLSDEELEILPEKAAYNETLSKFPKYQDLMMDLPLRWSKEQSDYSNHVYKNQKSFSQDQSRGVRSISLATYSFSNATGVYGGVTGTFAHVKFEIAEASLNAPKFSIVTLEATQSLGYEKQYGPGQPRMAFKRVMDNSSHRFPILYPLQ